MKSKKKQKTGRRSVSLRLSTYEKLNEHCKKTGETMSGLVEKLIANHLSKGNGKPLPDQQRKVESVATTDPLRGGGTHLL